jgi:hypothetical protein
MYFLTVKNKTNEKKVIFWGILEEIEEKCRIRILIRKSSVGSKDPDTYQNVTDPDTDRR